MFRAVFKCAFRKDQIVKGLHLFLSWFCLSDAKRPLFGSYPSIRTIGRPSVAQFLNIDPSVRAHAR
jgi:hypothetical protein